ncbi:hypothetical protein SPRG_21344 [Saprolegnia parasitica CBS 223.65]|uniref:Uncharacterized protein n=1 Tax=Saprolegnia parasitica (strain CBS 223.65) TaxID=695850 RepID=A0A067BW86_SAPPC|nr:hypothetical protein SPRG_21344 [Saprolegnia parasitica CBS 223.65]KDO21100.1 hypothetical protein SPRG_21344 [Saprolegnia parasitica CBS 223.65]|eukprot:XP_012208214.1 hypothetical protein SPRG_21344 [Saprolegnia parasitica CBS 223.65]
MNLMIDTVCTHLTRLHSCVTVCGSGSGGHSFAAGWAVSRPSCLHGTVLTRPTDGLETTKRQRRRWPICSERFTSSSLLAFLTTAPCIASWRVR